jgi:hypothetical protein
MQYVNLTPHAVTILDADGSTAATYPATGQAARITTEAIGTAGDVTTVRYGRLAGLASPAKDTTYIVSLVCLLALQGTRADVVAPWGEVRDDNGRIIGCRGLHRLSDTDGALYEVDGRTCWSLADAEGEAQALGADGYQAGITEIPRP